MSQKDPSHNAQDSELTEQQHRSMPKVTKPDECAKVGKTECDDKTCQYFGRGCAISGRQKPETGKPTERRTPE